MHGWLKTNTAVKNKKKIGIKIDDGDRLFFELPTITNGGF